MMQARGIISSMSGHSKWATIKHKKALTDAKKGAAFTKIANQIVIAVRNGKSGDPDMNPSLRLILDKARQVNMPNDNVKRAIDRGLGKDGGAIVEEVNYEGYGPFGVGIIVKTVTDNHNRTGSEIRNIFEKNGGSIAGPGSVSYLLNITPTPTVTLTGADLEHVENMLELLEDHDDVVEVWSNLDTQNA